MRKLLYLVLLLPVLCVEFYKGVKAARVVMREREQWQAFCAANRGE